LELEIFQYHVAKEDLEMKANRFTEKQIVRALEDLEAVAEQARRLG
jgi:hypothetical protein